MKKILLLASLSLTLLSGCFATGAHIMSGILPVPKPELDDFFHSVDYYNNKLGIDITTLNHSMDEQKQRERNIADACTKIASHIKINGSSKPCPTNLRVLNKAKKIGPNDYYIGCSSYYKGEIQKGDGYCWASCSQFIIASVFKKYVDQEKIVIKIKGSSPKEMLDQAGTVSDAIRALGFSGVTIMPTGSEIILASLTDNIPVMVGVYDEGEQVGHAVVIVSAKFSFPDATHLCSQCSKFAFSSFEVFDPFTGKVTTWPASKFENKINFILTFATINDH